MRITPSQRNRAHKMETHHMLWRSKDWRHESLSHKTAVEHRAYQVRIPGMWHDILHTTIDRVPLPSAEIAGALVEIGEYYQDWSGMSKMDSMLNTMEGYAMSHPSPEKSDELLTVMGSLAAQQGLFKLYQSMR